MKRAKVKKVTVIIPVYNVMDYLKRCVDSVLNQTYKNLEIILVDDGSTDGCNKVCDDYLACDHRIKVIHKANGGLSSARNAGIDAATGDYYIFVDSDDYIMPDMVEKMYNRMLVDESDLVICNINYVDESGNKISGKNNSVQDEVIDKYQYWTKFYWENYDYCVVAWNKMYPKRMFDGLGYKEGHIHEDDYIIHKIISKTEKISLMTDKLYFYTKRKGSIMDHYSLNGDLDQADAILNRCLYLHNNKYYKQAETTLMHCIGILNRAYSELKTNEEKKRFRKIYGLYRTVYRETINIRWPKYNIFKGGLFYFSCRFYNVVSCFKFQ